MAAPSAADVVSRSLSELASISDRAEKTKAIQFIVYVAGCPTADFLRHTLLTLVQLAADPSNRECMVQEGAARPLVRLLSEQWQEKSVLIDSATALASLAYDEHKSFYSWLLGSTVNFVYSFGFVLMTPRTDAKFLLRKGSCDLFFILYAPVFIAKDRLDFRVFLQIVLAGKRLAIRARTDCLLRVVVGLWRVPLLIALLQKPSANPSS